MPCSAPPEPGQLHDGPQLEPRAGSAGRRVVHRVRRWRRRAAAPPGALLQGCALPARFAGRLGRGAGLAWLCCAGRRGASVPARSERGGQSLACPNQIKSVRQNCSDARKPTHCAGRALRGAGRAAVRAGAPGCVRAAGCVCAGCVAGARRRAPGVARPRRRLHDAAVARLQQQLRARRGTGETRPRYAARSCDSHRTTDAQDLPSARADAPAPAFNRTWATS
jgi:hypothetical protein